MPVVAANGARFHVQRLGSGPPVAMLHGLFVGSLAQWYFTAAPALATAHEVFLYDLRGHGKSDRPTGGYDLATMTGDFAALTADYRPVPITVVGHSYGALIALRFALDHPERVARLVLVEAPLPPSRFGDFGELVRRPPGEMLEALPPPLAAYLGRGGRQARRLLANLRFLASECSLVADLEAEPDIADAELAGLSCPTLCLYGASSACRESGERLARVVPGAALELLPGGHYLHLDAPAELTRRIAEFCRG